MKLFDKIPKHLFNVLSSKNNEVYIEAMFVIRNAFITELVIKRSDLVSMLIDSLEDRLIEADFSDELDAEDIVDNKGQSFFSWDCHHVMY